MLLHEGLCAICRWHVIGYRQLGHGPGVILVHGGMQASQDFMKLATELSGQFTIYVPDRRGRGLSGPFGDNYSVIKECEDVATLVGKTGARNIFGLSSGAIIALRSSLAMPESSQCSALRAAPLRQRINPRIVGASIRTGDRARQDHASTGYRFQRDTGRTATLCAITALHPRSCPRATRRDLSTIPREMTSPSRLWCRPSITT